MIIYTTMKWLKTYKIFETESSFMYDPKIEELLPEYITVIKGDFNKPEKMIYKKSISRHLGLEVQIPYETVDLNGGRENPDTLEFDIYWSVDLNTNKLSIITQINFGDLTACEFSIKPRNNIGVIRYTSLHSKDDKSNTVFALNDLSIGGLCEYFNAWDKSIHITPQDLKFLDGKDDYLPN
jgi:hypothetical protein